MPRTHIPGAAVGSGMPSHRLGSILSLVRQGLALEIGFGTHSLEALIWIAESVEQSVYTPGSLVATADGLAFSLSNPPLRAGAFRGLRVRIDGGPVAPDRVRVRTTAGRTWRTAASVASDSPLALTPGDPIDFEIVGLPVPMPRRPTVRLELDSVAIPPVVWVEFTDDVRAEVTP